MIQKIRKAVKKMGDNFVEIAKIKKDMTLEMIDRLSNMKKNNKIAFGIGVISIGIGIGGSIIIGALLEE